MPQRGEDPTADTPASQREENDLILGRAAVERGWITPEQLADAYAEQARGTRTRSIGNILASKGYLSDERLIALLEELKGSTLVVAPQKNTPFPMPFGKYTLVREVGRGGMGVVYEALDTILSRKVALKVVLSRDGSDPDQVREESERFMREARLSANLSKHPNIVGVYDAGIVDGRCYLAMEFIEGAPFSKWRRSPEANLRDDVRILREVARAVHHAHGHGIIHRDLKPDNILLSSGLHPHVTDFGLAKSLDPSVSGSLTGQGRVMGTPIYMSPEQAQGLSTLDSRTDIYSLAVILYEALAGHPPFTAKTAVELLTKVVREPVPPPLAQNPAGSARGGDARLEKICLRGMSKDPSDRQPTAEVLANDLDEWLNAAPGPSPAATLPAPSSSKQDPAPGASAKEAPPSVPPPPPAPRRRRSSLQVIALLLVVVLAAGGGYVAFGMSPVERELDRARLWAWVGWEPEAIRIYTGILSKAPGQPQALAERARLLQRASSSPSLPIAAHAPPARAPKDAASPPGEAKSPPDSAPKPTREAEAARAAAVLAHHKGPADPAFIAAVAALPPESQAAPVVAKLKELNPGYNGKEKHRIEAGKLEELSITSSALADLSPLRALPDLKFLEISAEYDPAVSKFVRGQLTDLAPLKGLPLERLRIQGTAVHDLSPLQGMPLALLRCDSTEITDLSPLAGSRLTWLDVVATPVADLSPLAGLPLDFLSIGGTKVTDLSPLKGLNLHHLFMHALKITDYSPIRNLPLRSLKFDYLAERDAPLIRSMKSLEKINDLPAADFVARFGHPWECLVDGHTLEGAMFEPRAGWSTDKGMIFNLGKDSTLLTRAEFDDGEFRVRFRSDALTFLSITVRHLNEKGFTVTPDVRVLNESPRVKVHEVIFTCREDQMSAKLDGQDVQIKNRNGPRRGPIQVHVMGGHLTVISIDRRP